METPTDTTSLRRITSVTNAIRPICHPKTNVRNRHQLINLIAKKILTISSAIGPKQATVNVATSKHFNHGRIRRLPFFTDELAATKSSWQFFFQQSRPLRNPRRSTANVTTDD